MQVLTWNSPIGFKIKSKSDVDHFLTTLLGKGEFYLDVGDEYDWNIDTTYPGYPKLLVRDKNERGDIFAPYCEAIDDGLTSKETIQKWCWIHRKHLNEKFFGR
jgi:hypothetical protein